MLDVALGRWHVPDPLAEWHFKNTPYNYCINNPVRFIDPFGLDTTYYVPPLPDIIVTPPPSEDTPKTDHSKNWLYSLFSSLPSLEGNYNSYRVRDATEYEKWCQRTFDQNMVILYGEALGDYRGGSYNENTVRNGDIYQGRRDEEETSDKEINEKTGNKTDGSGVEYGKGKYKKWKRIESLVGRKYTDATEDSLLYVFRGDSILWVSDVKGDWRKNGRHRIKTNNKK